MMLVLTLAAMLAAERRNVVIQIPAPPAPHAVASGARAEAMLVDFVPGPIQCDGTLVRTQSTVDPEPVGAFLRPDIAPTDFELTFRIDPGGRPVGIGEPRRVDAMRTSVYNADLPAALSLWRFAPSRSSSHCSIRFTPRARPISTAPIEAVQRFAALARAPAAGVVEARARVRDTGCLKPTPPRLLLRGYPDYAKLPQPSGGPAYSLVAFDIDPAGVPVNIGTQGSSGAAALDEASRDAIARSRFAEGDPRQRCQLPFVQGSRFPVAAPPHIDLDPLRPERATCDEVMFVTLPALIFPPAFERRSIDGWAVIRFDVGPGGQIGNVAVAAAEPAAEFGSYGMRVVRGARLDPATSPATGCLKRINFRIRTSERPA